MGARTPTPPECGCSGLSLLTHPAPGDGDPKPIPSEGPVSVDNVKRVEMGVHDLPGAQQVEDHGHAEPGQQDAQGDVGCTPHHRAWQGSEIFQVGLPAAPWPVPGRPQLVLTKGQLSGVPGTEQQLTSGTLFSACYTVDNTDSPPTLASPTHRGRV